MSAVLQRQASLAPRTASLGVWGAAWKRFRSDRVGMTSLVIVCAFGLLVIAAGLGLVAGNWQAEVGVPNAPPTFVGPRDAVSTTTAIPLPKGNNVDISDVDPLAPRYAEWDAAMRVNVKGIWYCCRAVVPKMRERGGGSIVNVASLAATYGMPYGLHYSTSKAAVIGLTRALAREIGRNEIHVNALAPTAVITEGTREFFGPKSEGALDTIKSGQAIPRNPEADDMVGTVMWLISDASKFVTGQTIMVDGGTVFL